MMGRRRSSFCFNLKISNRQQRPEGELSCPQRRSNPPKEWESARWGRRSRLAADKNVRAPFTAVVAKLSAWFAQNARDLPWRRTCDPYAIWVSEVMLQQTRVGTVIPYWQRWMRALPDVAALARAKPEKIHKLWEGLGYYTRVRNMQKGAQLIVERHGGRFPKKFEDVLALPGIGRYTAGAICSIAFNQPQPILDGNVVRVLARLFGIFGNPHEKSTNTKLWKLAEQLVLHAANASPGVSGLTHHFPCSLLNQSLMELGALICTPRQPQCSVCPVAKHCAALRQNRVMELPQLPPRQGAISQRFLAFVAQQGRRFLVRQRPPGIVNAHLWEFPNIECPEPASARSTASQNSRAANGICDQMTLKRAARRAVGFRPHSLEPLCTIRHSITRYRITLEVLRVAAARTARAASRADEWRTLRELKQLPFASAHRQILERL